nr:disease resistance protein At4g27190-like [Ipomoea batatas]
METSNSLSPEQYSDELDLLERSTKKTKVGDGSANFTPTASQSSPAVSPVVEEVPAAGVEMVPETQHETLPSPISSDDAMQIENAPQIQRESATRGERGSQPPAVVAVALPRSYRDSVVGSCPTSPIVEPTVVAGEPAAVPDQDNTSNRNMTPQVGGPSAVASLVRAKPYEPWMIAPRKERRTSGRPLGEGVSKAAEGGSRTAGAAKQMTNSSGSRFAPLNEESDSGDRSAPVPTMEPQSSPASQPAADALAGAPKHQTSRRANVVVNEKQIANEPAEGRPVAIAERGESSRAQLLSSCSRSVAAENEHVVVRGEKGALTEPFRVLFGSIYARIKNVFKIHSNYKDLEKNMESLLDLKQLLDDDELQQRHLPRTQVRNWLKRVEKLQNEFDSITTNGNHRFSNRIVKGLVEVKKLIGDGRAFEDKIVGLVPNAVEYIPAPSIEGQPTAKRNLDKIMGLLKRNEKAAKTIGVWGMGGAGKSTLVKNVNNELSKDPTNQGFNIVIWVVVSQNETVEIIQSKIAARLELAMNKEETKESAASHLYNKLKGKRFLLILDNIWEGVDLNAVGIPPLEDHDSKVILTTRNFHVCQEMSTDIEFEIGRLSDEEAWKLFSEKVGEEVVNDDQMMPLAKVIVEECDGLPLALIIIGASLRKKAEVALWKSALYALQKSEPTHIHGVEEKVYRPLKWSYDSLKGEQLKSCFLFCCLYPEDFDIRTNRLVHYWLAEGLLDEQQNYEQLQNDVKRIVDCLISSCLLEKCAVGVDKVKMHDVVRDVGVWIAKSSMDWCKSIISSGISEVQISQQLLSCSDKVKRVSFMHSKIAFLPDNIIQCPEATTLFLQGNRGLHEIPNPFLQGFQMLTTLDLSKSNIMCLPDSLLQLGELRALILRGCQLLHELPPLEALRKLQILDCGYTKIAKLPAGFETLANLRILLLDGTHQLTEIPNGKICKLHKLEFLNTEYSGIQWGTRDTIEANAPFEDLLCLNQLILLYIDLKHFPCFTTQHPSWLKRIKKFRFHVDRNKDWSSKIGNEVLLRSLHFSGDEMVGLFINARCFSIGRCEKVDLMLDSLVKNSASLGPFVNLKKLSIQSCRIFGKPLSLGICHEQMDLLPNLEFLRLCAVIGLESLSSISNFLGLRFTKLKEIEVRWCGCLQNLLVMDGSFQKLDKVEKISIYGCRKLTQVFKNTLMDNIVPNLRTLFLCRLPALKGICNANVSWKSLEQLEVRECNMLGKLPLGMQSAESIQSIWGGQHWWDALEWDSENFKEHLVIYNHTSGHLNMAKLRPKFQLGI